MLLVTTGNNNPYQPMKSNNNLENNRQKSAENQHLLRLTTAMAWCPWCSASRSLKDRPRLVVDGFRPPSPLAKVENPLSFTMSHTSQTERVSLAVHWSLTAHRQAKESEMHAVSTGILMKRKLYPGNCPLSEGSLARPTSTSGVVASCCFFREGCFTTKT